MVYSHKKSISNKYTFTFFNKVQKRTRINQTLVTNVASNK